MAICSDGIGIIPIVFPDHEVRKLIGKCVFELRLEDDTGFPKTLMELEIINSQSHWKFLKKILQKQVICMWLLPCQKLKNLFVVHRHLKLT